MFLENRKLKVLSAILTVIGLVSATGVLLGYAVKTVRGEVQPSLSSPENNQTASEKPTNGTGAQAPRVAVAQPRDGEKDLIRLAELQADAELLELTLDGQKASILHSIQFLSGRVSRYAVQDRDRGVDWQQSLQKVNDQLAQDQESFRRNKIKLALLKYQIARESKALGVTVDASAPLTELNRRLDRLEEKIDRLTSSLGGKAGP
jgi:uncharacterized coiled-coil protein SlyX